MTFLSSFSTRISFFQSFGVQMVHYIIHKTSWYIELIGPRTAVGFSCAWLCIGVASGASKFNSTALRSSSTVRFFFIVKNLILTRSPIKRADAPGIDTVVPAHKVQNF